MANAALVCISNLRMIELQKGIYHYFFKELSISYEKRRLQFLAMESPKAMYGKGFTKY